MSYCINPNCQHRENSPGANQCHNCGFSLIINDRYRIVRPWRELNPIYPTDIYEVQDWGEGNWGARKVMKVLKYSSNPDWVRLFKREARVGIWLRHPAIPQVEPDGYFTLTLPGIKRLHCLVMEKIPGENLETYLEKSGKISQIQAVAWLEQLIEIIEALHQEKLIHRDIKPANLILRPDGKLALIDLGSVADRHSGTTRIGTSGYAAPEQILGKSIPQSDFFAIARTVVHWVTGNSPMNFPETGGGQLIWRESASQISPQFADLLDRMMAPQPDRRPQTLSKIREQLTEIQEAIASTRSPNPKFQ